MTGSRAGQTVAAHERWVDRLLRCTEALIGWSHGALLCPRHLNIQLLGQQETGGAMRGMRFRTVMAVAAATAALGAVSACGGKSASATGEHAHAAPSPVAVSPMAYLLKVEDATAKVHSAEVDQTVAVGTMREMRIAGDNDWANGLQGNVTFSVKTSAQTPVSPLRMEIRSDAMYVRVPAQNVAKLGGKHWVKEPLDLLAAQGDGGKAETDQLRRADPTMEIRMLIASGDVRKVGQETVRGVTATHYTGTLDLAKVIASKQGLTPDDVKFLKKEVAAQGATDGHVDLWVNSDNLPVETQEQVQTDTARVTSTTYYSNYGVAVDLSLPAESDTFTLHSVTGGNASGAV
ncbi:hypothetical protein [Streptomyces silvisoli]|uniref:LppX_LprAFG lipoprotein n=1 Tax=Streptomyces silvisoli TaxID=3034235 RepID=A0ABT5ZQD0_9ACTN|nr:hypothetical protein [Streptomyces silvisoli]MDF3292032.1 hypothetical protein [Streptomyces silvisoli]